MNIKEYKQQVKKIQNSSLNLIQASEKIQAILSQFNLPPTSYKDRVIRAQKDLNNIYLTSTQRMIIDEISRELASLVPFHDFVIRGFLWRAIRLWQRKNGLPIILVARMDRLAQFRIGIEILNYFKLYLNRAMFIPDLKIKKKFTNEVLRKISEYYEELLAALAFLKNPINEEILLDYEIEKWLQKNSSLFSLEK